VDPARRPDRPEGEGFRLILHGLNPERSSSPLKAVGIAAPPSPGPPATRASARVQPADRHDQGIQHPLAKCWAQLEAAN